MFNCGFSPGQPLRTDAKVELRIVDNQNGKVVDFSSIEGLFTILPPESIQDTVKSLEGLINQQQTRFTLTFQVQPINNK